MACPFVYAYEAWGHTYVGCMQKIFDVEIDLELLEEAESGRGGFGAVRARRAPLPMCEVEVVGTYPHREDDLGCRNPEFHELPRERATFRVFATRRGRLAPAARSAAGRARRRLRMRSRSSVAFALVLPRLVIAGRPANAGWPRKVASPSPMSPVPTQLVPVAVRAERRLRVVHVEDAEAVEADLRVERHRRRRRARRGSDTSTPDAHQWHESRQRPSRGWRSSRRRERRELGDRAADRPARAGGVLHAQPEVVGRQLEELAKRRLDELDGLVEAVAEVRADVEDDGVGADRVRRLHRRAQRRERVLADDAISRLARFTR